MNATIQELRNTGWNYAKLIRADQKTIRCAVLVSVQTLVTDWDQLTERATRAEAENVELRATIAALTAAIVNQQKGN